MTISGKGRDLRSTWFYRRHPKRGAGDASLLYPHVSADNTGLTSPEHVIFTDWFFGGVTTVAIVAAGYAPSDSVATLTALANIVADSESPSTAAASLGASLTIVSSGAGPSNATASLATTQAIIAAGHQPSHAAAVLLVEATDPTVGVVCLQWLSSGSPLALAATSGPALELSDASPAPLALAATSANEFGLVTLAYCCGAA